MKCKKYSQWVRSSLSPAPVITLQQETYLLRHQSVRIITLFTLLYCVESYKLYVNKKADKST